MNKIISTPKAVVTIVVLAVLFVGAIFAYQYYWPSLEQKTEIIKTENKEATIVSFEIVPSCEMDKFSLLHPIEPKMIVKGENLADVRFFIAPAGSSLGEFLYRERPTVKNGDQWEAILINSAWLTDITAIGYDTIGNEVGRIKIGKSIHSQGASGGGINSPPQYPQDCMLYGNSKGFSYQINDSYLYTKEVLKANGWVPVIEDLSEISSCGSGVDAICTVDFKKIEGEIEYRNHLNLQSKNSIWIVVGSE